MHDFLIRAALRGSRPAHLSTFRAYKRSSPMMALMRERTVARFVVAPAGFGKTTLLLEYAESIFSFHHVFWVRCDQSGFLSCLDAGNMAREIMLIDQEAPLVVFDDVPQLDAARAAGFMQTVETLLAAGCEVIASMGPVADSYGCIVDRITVGAADLMVSNEEIVSASIASSYCVALDPLSVPRAQRVPGLIWAEPDSAKLLLSRVVSEDLSSEFLLPMFCMLVAGSGQLDELEHIVRIRRDTMDVLACSYLFLGIDEVAGTFQAAPFGIELVANVFKGRVRVLSEHSRLATEEALIEALADWLLRADDLARACDLVRLAALPAPRAAWLSAHERVFLDGCCLIAPSALFRSLASRARTSLPSAFEACRLALLDDKVGAAGQARRALALGGSDGDAADSTGRLLASACLALSTVGDAHEAAIAAAKEAVSCICDEATGPGGAAEASKATGPGEAAGASGASGPGEAAGISDLACALNALIALEQGPGQAAEVWLAAFEGVRFGVYPLLAGAVVLSAAAGAQPAGAQPPALQLPAARPLALQLPAARPLAASDPSAVKRLDALAGLCASIASAVSRAYAQAGELTLPAALAALAFERVRAAESLGLVPLDDDIMEAARSFERMLSSQRVHAERRRRARAHEALCRRAASRDPLKRTTAPASITRPPFLTVNLFGGMDVRIGGEQVDRKLLHRRKVRLLLALLVLRRGNEVPRTYLAEQLYPESGMDKGLANISSLKSKLADILKAPDGTCPYLVERQGSFGLDASLLRSDVIEIDAVCDALSRRAPSQGDWSSLLARANDVFADDLLPGEAGIPAIEPVRRRYRTKLVDAFVTASDILVHSERPHDGLLYARAAYDRDSRREDVCYALMKAQYACLQTASAIDTYLRCSRYLSEELGMDTSPKTDALYRKILDREEITDSPSRFLCSRVSCDRVTKL